jgi:hypothetical protein
MRNIYSYSDVGQVTGIERKGKAVDYTDVPAQTMRNIYSYSDVGQVTGIERKGKAVDYTDVPAQTMRNIHSYNDICHAKSNVDKSYQINYNDATPAMTQRDITGETYYVAPANDKINKPRNRIDVYNAQLNTTKEIVSKGRTPTLIGRNKGHTIDFTNFEFENDDNTFNRSHSPTPINPTFDRLPQKVSKNRNQTWFPNTRINCYPEEVLDQNPYINNVVHKAVKN